MKSKKKNKMKTKSKDWQRIIIIKSLNVVYFYFSPLSLPLLEILSSTACEIKNQISENINMKKVKNVFVFAFLFKTVTVKRKIIHFEWFRFHF